MAELCHPEHEGHPLPPRGKGGGVRGCCSRQTCTTVELAPLSIEVFNPYPLNTRLAFSPTHHPFRRLCCF